MERFRSFGWRTIGAHPQLVVDALIEPAFGMARSWSPRAAFSLLPSSDLLYALLVLDGRASLRAERWSAEIKAGQLIILPSKDAVRLDSEKPLTQFLWYLKPTILKAPIYQGMAVRPLSIRSAGRQILVSTSNAILNSTQEPAPSAIGHLRAAVENLLAGVIIDQPSSAAPSPAIPSLGENSLLSSAVTVIERRFRDTDFDIEHLAQELGISRASLYRAFEDVSTTPWAEIDRRRTFEAEMLLAVGKGRFPRLHDIAIASGFHSTRQMRTARQRWKNTAPRPLEAQEKDQGSAPAG